MTGWRRDFYTEPQSGQVASKAASVSEGRGGCD